MAQEVPASVPGNCRVATYNVLYEGAGCPHHTWEDRREGVRSELRRLDPDVVALQELWENQLRDLESGLPGFSVVAADEGQKHTAIAYRSDRFELLNGDTFWLAPTGTPPGVPAWDAAYQRRVTQATLLDRGADWQFSVISLHLDNEGETARKAGITHVRDRLDEQVPAVVAGDFNSQPGDPGYQRAVARSPGRRQLTDTAAVADTVNGPDATFVGFGRDHESRNIDHILVTGEWCVTRRQTAVPPPEYPVQPSDHRPVFADLRY